MPSVRTISRPRHLPLTLLGALLPMLAIASERAPMKRNITTEEIGQTAAFLVSDGGAGITGETIFVDAGYHAVGM